MMASGVTFILFAVMSAFSLRHSMGFWILLMITHGIFYQYLGQGSEHIPLAGGLAVVIVIAIRRKWQGISLADLGLLLALLLAMGLAAITGVNQQYSLITLLMYAKGFFLVLLLAGTLHEDRDIRLMTLYCLAGLVLGGLFAVFQKMTGNFVISTIYDQRAAGLRGDPNDTAMLLVAGIPLCLHHLFAARTVALKCLYLCSMVALLAGIILTGSRGGFIALMLILLLVFLRRPSLRLFGVGMVLAIAFAVMAPRSYWDRMQTLVSGQEKHQSQSLKSRYTLQKIGMDIFLDYPVLGVGPGNFSPVFMDRFLPTAGGRFARESVGSERTYAVAHNMYLEFFVENGMIGGFLLLAVFWRSMQGMLAFDRSRGVARGGFGLGFSIVLALSGMLFAGLFLSQAKNSVLWFITGIGFAAGMLARVHPEREAAVHLPEGQALPQRRSLPHGRTLTKEISQ